MNTKGEGEKSSEDFWVKAERLYYSALIGYIWYEATEEEKNFITLLDLINASEAREDDETYQSPVDLLFSQLEEREPDHFAVKQYRKFKMAAGVVCSKRLLNQAVGKSLRTHNLKPKKGAQVMRKNEKITALYERLSRDDFDRFLSERKDTRKVFLCLDSDTAGSEACTRLAQSIPGEIAVIRLVPARKDWNDVLRQQGDIPSRKFIAETITLRELPTAQPVPMLRMADVELTSVDWLWFPYIPFGKLTIIQGNPGEGKTYFAMRLAAACTNRKPLPGMETLEPFNIIYQTAEDGLGDTVKPRLMEAEADLERVLVIDDRDTRPYQTNNFYVALERQAQAEKEVKAIVQKAKARAAGTAGGKTHGKADRRRKA